MRKLHNRRANRHQHFFKIPVNTTGNKAKFLFLQRVKILQGLAVARNKLLDIILGPRHLHLQGKRFDKFNND